VNEAALDPGLYADGRLSESQARALIAAGRELRGRDRCRNAAAFYAPLQKRYLFEAPYFDYQIARCDRCLGRYAAAERYFHAAANQPRPENFGRASDLQNAFIRRLTARYGIPLADEAALFRARSPHGLMGTNLFADGQHPNAEGYALMADAFAEAAARRLGVPVRPFRNARNLARRVGLTPQDFAAADTNAGQWLFSVSAENYDPGQRLGLARRRFLEALKISPDDFQAWLGLGLVQAAQNGNFMTNPAFLRALARYHLYYWPEIGNNLPAVLAFLRANTVPAPLLAKIKASFAADRAGS